MSSYNNQNFNITHSKAVQIIRDYYEKISDVTDFNAEFKDGEFKITRLGVYRGELIPHLSYMSEADFKDLLEEALEFNCYKVRYIRMRHISKDDSIYYQVGIRLVDDLPRTRKRH